jgi:transposase
MAKRSKESWTAVVGLDLGDRNTQVCVLARASGEVLEEARMRTTPEALRKRFAGKPRLRIALEVGTHSPWVSRLLEELGHEVFVANASQVRLIYENRRKSDRVDAQYLARLARLDPALLAPIQHRSAQAQADLAMLRSRDALVRARTSLINHVRGVVKTTGGALPSGRIESFATRARARIPEALKPAVEGLLEILDALSGRIRTYDRQIEALAATRYPEAKITRQPHGVGPLTSLAFVLTLEDPQRFVKSRRVGAYVGLVPGRRNSSESDPPQRITKRGDAFLRRLLVQSAHYMLGPFGRDSDLRRYGERLVARGGKNAKRRAVIAVARKLSVLLHRLWRNGEVYQPLYAASRSSGALARAS